MKRNRVWLFGLACITLVLTLGLGLLSAGLWPTTWGTAGLPTGNPVYAQAPPAPVAPEASPSPAASPTGETTPPAPVAAPTEADATSPVAPLPPVPVEESPAASPLAGNPTLPLAGNYEDPENRFQVGILEGYKVTSVARTPLFEAVDGRIAYSLVVVPADQTAIAPLPENALVQVAQTVFGRGEGFRLIDSQPLPDGVLLSWLGSLTIGGTPQGMQGNIIARQSNGNVVLLLIAVTAQNGGAEELPAVTSTLYESLQLS
jgi:hypothetical protein